MPLSTVRPQDRCADAASSVTAVRDGKYDLSTFRPKPNFNVVLWGGCPVGAGGAGCTSRHVHRTAFDAVQVSTPAGGCVGLCLKLEPRILWQKRAPDAIHLWMLILGCDDFPLPDFGRETSWLKRSRYPQSSRQFCCLPLALWPFFVCFGYSNDRIRK